MSEHIDEIILTESDIIDEKVRPEQYRASTIPLSTRVATPIGPEYQGSADNNIQSNSRNVEPVHWQDILSQVYQDVSLCKFVWECYALAHKIDQENGKIKDGMICLPSTGKEDDFRNLLVEINAYAAGNR